MKDSFQDYRSDYVGPEYEMTRQVSAFHGINRFGRSSDITDVLSADQDAQASYIAGLIALTVFSLIFFIFWTVGLVTFKCMSTNAGFLAGNPFKARVDTEHRCMNKQVVGRILFLVATAILWFSSVLLLVKGVTELDDTANAADNTLVTLRSKIEAAEDITASIQEVGIQSVKIRDKVVYLFDTVICDAIDIESTIGISLSDLKYRARYDLNQLANFLYDSLGALLSGIATANNLTATAEGLVSEIRLGGWPAIFVSGLLFILPSFFVVGVIFAFKSVNAKRFQLYLSYVILPMFMGVIGFCVVVCCILIPLAVINADFCTGSATSGGPDDTILTSYRNLLGNDQSIRFHVVAYYTQRCLPKYYPFGFLGTYFDMLGTAQSSIEDLITALGGNLNLIQQQCGTDDGGLFLSLAQSMKSNLDLLRETVDDTLDLVNCEDINNMYASAVHSATCTHAPAAVGWIYGTLLTISISGFVMITLRSAYLPSDQEAPDGDNKQHNTSNQRSQESAARVQRLYRDQQNTQCQDYEPKVNNMVPSYYQQDQFTDNDMRYLPSGLTPRHDLNFVVVAPNEYDDVSAL